MGIQHLDGTAGDEPVTEAVNAALVADVPRGACLSGGVDSSLIGQHAPAVPQLHVARRGAQVSPVSSGARR
ncbi:asparagine synthase-related protein [Cryobacterium psychrophilum]|uniref:asparagine synthase-related protein n=1 Tax=Cryobacterium psychrophilum TaxID=41988 RepID=UPI001F543B80|nr:asparagine synthase-related protein [Cryobacterium psychrophilum]